MTRPPFELPSGLQATPGVLALYTEIGRPYPWFVTLATMLGSFATLLTSTIVNVAIPDIMGALGITLDQAQWLSTAFLASGTVTMLLTAWCIRAFGMRLTYMVAMLVFLIGSVMGGMAPSADVLFLSRVVQGAAAGAMMPISMVMISQVFPLAQRGRAMGLMSVGTVLAPALGPTLGGYLVDNLSWRWVFLMAIPFALITVPMARLYLPTREETGPAPSFDWGGVLLCTVFLTALLVGLSEAQRSGFSDEFVAVCLFVAVTSFVVWIAWELYVPDPMLELRLFLIPKFVAAAIVTFAVGIGLYGSTYILPLFLQTVVGVVPTESGLLLAPAGLMMAALFPAAGWLADISSPRRLILIGLVLVAISSYPLIWADVNMPVWDIAMWYVLGRVGLACIFPSLNAASLKPLSLALLAQGSGATNFLRQLGGAVGVNLISFMMQERIAFYQSSFTTDMNWGNTANFEMIGRLTEEFLRLGVPGYQAFESAYGFAFGSVTREALMMGYRDGFFFVLVIIVLTLIPAWFIDAGKGRTAGGQAPKRASTPSSAAAP